MHIWLVNPFDPIPGDAVRPGRYAFLSAMLAERGHRVTWLTSSFFHTTKSHRKGPSVWDELDGALRVVVLPTPAYQSNVGIRRIFNHVVYAHRVTRWASRQSCPPDLILCSSPPLSSARAAVDVARHLGAKSVVDIQDLWPEAFSMLLARRLRNAGSALLRPISRYATSTYAGADGLVAVCRTYVARASDTPGKTPRPSSTVVPLGVDLRFFDRASHIAPPASLSKQEDEFRATYIGTVGRAYDIATIIRAAPLIRPSCPHLRLVIVGHGPHVKRMVALAQQLGADNVRFTGFLPFDQMVGILGSSDIGLNAIADGHSLTFPNKVFEYMGAGLPIVSSVDGELGQLVTEQKIGLQYQAGSPDSLADALLGLHEQPQLCREMGQRARRLAEDRFDRHKSYHAYVRFLENIAGEPSAISGHAPSTQGRGA